MVAVSSTMQALGSHAHAFALPNVCEANSLVSLQGFLGRPLLVMFICNHCPYVIHIAEKMIEVANNAQSQGYGVVAISANDADSYPQDGPKSMTLFADKYGFEFPYLYDETQDVAKAYGAACTPDFFVYDKSHRLQYRGQMDSARPGSSNLVDGIDLVNALNGVLHKGVAQSEQTPSIGCNIKWRAGSEPDYF